MHGIGGVPLSSIGGGTRATYVSKVLGTGPIAYWPLWETSGTVAQCLINPLQNGTYSSDVATWPPGTGIGDGNSAPFFDGTNDFVNIYSATLAGVFSGTTGSIMSWARVANAGVWTDGLFHRIFTVGANANNMMGCFKRDLNNQVMFQYHANAVNQTIVQLDNTSTGWTCWIQTWDQPGANQWWGYRDGTVYGASPVGGLGVWVGPLANTFCYIGQYSGGVTRWHGWESNVAIWNRALSLGEAINLAMV